LGGPHAFDARAALRASWSWTQPPAIDHAPYIDVIRNAPQELTLTMRYIASMETKVVPLDEGMRSHASMAKLIAVRTMDADAFVEKHASGTLRKNKRLGMVWREQYLDERVAYEFGWEFQCLPRSRVTFGDAYTEGDTSALTESGWHIERFIELNPFAEDEFVAKYINVEYKDGIVREGVGMICRQTSAQWVPGGHIVFAIVATYDPAKKIWHEAKNPR
jgi:hypothetical protein